LIFAGLCAYIGAVSFRVTSLNLVKNTTFLSYLVKNTTFLS